MPPPSFPPQVFSHYPRTDSLRTRQDPKLSAYASSQRQRPGMMSTCPMYPSPCSLPTTRSRREGSRPPPPYPSANSLPEEKGRKESQPPPYPFQNAPESLPTVPAATKKQPAPYPDPVPLTDLEKQIVKPTRRGLTKKQKRHNSCTKWWCVVVLVIAMVLVFAVVGVSVWRSIEDREELELEMPSGEER